MLEDVAQLRGDLGRQGGALLLRQGCPVRAGRPGQAELPGGVAGCRLQRFPRHAPEGPQRYRHVPELQRGLPGVGLRAAGPIFTRSTSNQLSVRAEPWSYTVMISFSLAWIRTSTFLFQMPVTFSTSASAALAASSGSPSFWAFRMPSMAFWRAPRMLTLAFSPSLLAIFTRSFRRSSVSMGTRMMMLSPLLLGLKPRLAAWIAFSMGSIIFFSHGCTMIVRASGVFTLLTWLKGTSLP